ncbi:hypothetical protein ACQEVF_43965 [Nonomuraea polychroma]|uniref:hypothetical protein n=1 Tax=Nonomuraea polychroma TaxID=46176 RepID=UPI003D8A5388
MRKESQMNWGAYYSPGANRAEPLGTITATGQDHPVIPSAATLTVPGKVSDLTRSSSRGWPVFNIAMVNAAGSKGTWKRHHVSTYAYRTPNNSDNCASLSSTFRI